MIACKHGRVQTIKALLKSAKTKDLNIAMFKNKKGVTALHFAAENNQMGAMRLLLEEEKADVNVPEKSTKYTPLMKACIQGHIDMVKLLVEEGKADIEKKDKFKHTAIMLAAKNGHLRIVSYLLHMNANIKVVDSSKNTLLHYAAAYGWFEICKYLVEVFAFPINDLNDWKVSPLSVAVLKGHFRITEFLMSNKANPNVCDEEGRSILLQSLNVDINDSLVSNINYLVESCGSSVNHQDQNGQAALHYLAGGVSYNHENPEKLERSIEDSSRAIQLIGDILLKKGADINMLDKKKQTPLMAAFASQNIGAIMFFLARGASIDGIYEETGSNLLHLLPSIYKSHWNKFAAISKLILGSPIIRSIVNHINKQGMTPLLSILDSYKKPDVRNWNRKEVTVTDLDLENIYVDFLNQFLTIAQPDTSIVNDRDPNAMEIDSNTNAKKAGEEGEEDEEEEEDEDNGSDDDGSEDNYDSDNDSYDDSEDDYPTSHNNNDSKKPQEFSKKSALHFAVLTGVSRFIETLLASKLIKSLDMLDSKQQTPLLTAIQDSKFDCAIILVDKGANLSTTDRNSQTPLHLACQAMHFPLIKRLVAMGAKVNLQDKDKATALILASKKKHSIGDDALEGEENPISLLLKNKADPTICDNLKRSALHYCINFSTSDANTSFELEDLLIKHGAQLNAVDYLGRTPLHYCFIKMGQNKITDGSTFDPIQTVSSLCSHPGIQVDVADKFGRTPLFYAAQHGSTVSALHLLQRKAEINRLDEDQNSPLSLALNYNHPDCAINFIQKNANVKGTLTKYNLEFKKVPVGLTPEELAAYELNLQSNKHNRQGQGKRFAVPVKRGVFGAIANAHANTNANDKPKEQKELTFTTEVIKKNVETMGLFYHVVKNNYQGVAYIMLDAGLDTFNALHDALKADKYQLALTLISKVRELKEVQSTTHHQNIFHFIGLYPSSVTNWAHRVQQKLVQLGLPINVKDSEGRTPLHYAAKKLNANYTQFLLDNKLDINLQDKNGFSPLSLSLLDLDSTSITLPAEVKLLLNNGSNLEQLFPYADNKVTPLVFAILTKNIVLFKQLVSNTITLDNNQERPMKMANVNTPDALGQTPLMHAVRMNNVEFVEILLTLKANIAALDMDKKTVIHHVVNPTSYGSYENVKLLNLLAAKGAPIDTVDIGNHTPNYYASQQDSGKMSTALLALGAKPIPPATIPIRETSVITSWETINYEADVEKYLAKVAAKNKEEVSKLLPPKVDKRSGLAATCEVYTDDNGLIYDVLLTKVDAKVGSYGMNNFYILQLLHNKNIDTFVLFNCFGRIGQSGQFQKTAYSKDEAILEFGKIFKSKTGQTFAKFDDATPFVRVPEKYNLQKIDRHEHKRREVLKPFKMNKYPPSKLPLALQDVMSQFCDVQAIEQQLKQLRINVDIMPLGRLSKDTIHQAVVILGRLKDQVETLGKAMKDDIKSASAIGEEILALNNQFYELIPHAEFAMDKMQMLTDDRQIGAKMTLLQNLDELEVVSKILLAAHSNKKIHPYDYCLKAIGVSLEALAPTSPEFSALKSYAVNTGCRADTVANIFRLQRQGEAEHFTQRSKSLDNHFLLWHGTKTTNYLSILSQGLKIAPPEAPATGYMFGKGIYFADLFTKSHGYCRGVGNSDQFLLLSEVALGKMKEYYESCYMDAAQPGTNSTKGIGRRGPEFDNSIVLTNGVTIPLGTPVDTKEPTTDDWHGFNLNMNEYIVYDVGQVRMRYLVQVSDKPKTYNK
ncbi:hypothetical protein SAMD00019534_087750 [Acytostelium subglobosum LB1]|uniref:hypothetical protein n=1 Tax=Acytostelium subglobosum LB1 TaxID=1410327 RepID=UPI000644BB96|nr:hypothetical protein SAMD00019534_087750 [Acytostelium subglobosum LB1]GAM25600.1 hypothetical protein SAMD00019534_087750 [Acytostelium subglobosum LB1]|eukprot:XP_012751586.1 hypothetical protein SAMD00019534_087750 [Acytostelium subglobosum LB1]